MDLDPAPLRPADVVQASKAPWLDEDAPRPPRERSVAGLEGIDPVDRAGVAVSWESLSAALSDPVLPTSQRNALLAAQRGVVHTVAVRVAQVGGTPGVLLPAHLQEGRTVSGHLDSGAPQVAVRMPAADNATLDALACSGEDGLTVQVRLRDWDALRRRLVFDAVGKTVTGGGSPPS